MNGVQDKSFGIKQVYAFVHWWDEITMGLSAWLLGIGFLLCICDIYTSGIFFSHDWTLPYWVGRTFTVQPLIVSGLILGLGVETTARTLIRRSARAYRAHGGMNWETALWGLLGLVVIGVGIQALVVFNLQHTLNLTEGVAYARSGIDPTGLAWERAVITGVLFGIAGLLEYTKPKPDMNTDQALAELKHKKAVLPHLMEVEALEAQRLASKGASYVLAARAVGGTVIKGRHPEIVRATALNAPGDDGDDDPTPPRGPRGGTRGPRGTGNLVPMNEASVVDAEPDMLNVVRGSASGALSRSKAIRAQRVLAIVDLLKEHAEHNVKTRIRDVQDRIGGDLSTSVAWGLLKDARLMLANIEGYQFDGRGMPVHVAHEATEMLAG